MIEEDYLATKYCEPKAYWHCLLEFGELIGTSYPLSDDTPPVLHELRDSRFKVQNYPERWLDAVRICTGREPSALARQLYRSVEEARAEFRAKQDRIWGQGLPDPNTRHEKYRREGAAWNTFSAQKQAYLKEYRRAVKTGVVGRRRISRRCRQCNAEKVIGRASFCRICSTQRHRQAARESKKRKTGL